MIPARSRALIVDQESSIRRLLQSKIEESGAAVDVAASASDGVKHLMRARYALIFVDLDLVHGQFADCVQTIRPRPITIGMTSSRDFSVERSEVRLIHAVIHKPADFERIAGVTVGILETLQRR